MTPILWFISILVKTSANVRYILHAAVSYVISSAALNGKTNILKIYVFIYPYFHFT